MGLLGEEIAFPDERIAFPEVVLTIPGGAESPVFGRFSMVLAGLRAVLTGLAGGGRIWAVRSPFKHQHNQSICLGIPETGGRATGIRISDRLGTYGPPAGSDPALAAALAIRGRVAPRRRPDGVGGFQQRAVSGPPPRPGRRLVGQSARRRRSDRLLHKPQPACRGRRGCWCG
jgi:hypothetical protein